MKRRFSVQLIAFILVLLFILTSFLSTTQSIQPIYQETVIVDQSGNGDFTSIKEAIENANALSIIRIKSGIYTESNLNIKKKFAIVGESPTDTIIDLNNNANIFLNSSYIELINLKIINPDENALFINWGSDYCNISNCIINGNQVHGILVQGSFTEISDCEIQGENSPGQGIKIRGNDNIIQRCSVQGFGEGILVLISSRNNRILNCNTFNNNVGVDIRISSSSNIISNSNIYGNKYGVYIWQNSDGNFVYQNNFWKNDIDAVDESDNIWDDSSLGNFWDDYIGSDKDGDGIGDSVVQISELNVDRYPLMNMIYPDVISSPTNILQTTPTWDNTPTFTWSPSIYDKGVDGYYIKIDKNPELYIDGLTSWTSTDFISNGVHTFYIRAKGDDNTVSSYSTLGFKIDTTFVDTDQDGWSDEEEQIYKTDPNDSDNYPIDTDNDHIPDIVDTDDDNDKYSDDMENSYNTNNLESNNYPVDTDLDGIPDNDSPDKKYVGDEDDDDDGLLDTVEIRLGSNPSNVYDVRRIYILGQQFYLVDILQNGIYDVLFDTSTEATYGLEKYSDRYLLDYNGDGTWDYVYSLSDMTINRYDEELDLYNLILIFTVIILLIIISILIYIYIKNKQIKEDEIIRKPTRKSALKSALNISKQYDDSTKNMIMETRDLLKNIQNDVTIYMNKIQQMEKQFILISSDDKKDVFQKDQIIKTKIKDNYEPKKIKPLSEQKEIFTDELNKNLNKQKLEEDKIFEEIDEVDLKSVENWLDSMSIRYVDSNLIEEDKVNKFLKRKNK